MKLAVWVSGAEVSALAMGALLGFGKGAEDYGQRGYEAWRRARAA